MTAPELVTLRDVAITHEGSDAASPASVDFSIAPGDVVLLLGPSGSGKSTLTLALNGLIPHAVPARVDGTITVDGLDTATASVAELSTRVGMVFQDPDAQLVTGTLLDEVAFGPENLRMPVVDVLARAETALRRVGLWERRADNPDTLSGGGRQRLAIACALAMGSPLLVLDEPTANLDPKGIEDVYAALADLVRAGDHAILLVEHNLDAALGFVDRVVVLDDTGRVIADGPVGTVLRERADELHALGVWLPVSTLAALQLRDAGYTLDPLPLTPRELRAALERTPRAASSADATAAAGAIASPRETAPHDTAKRQQTMLEVRGLSLRRGRSEVLHDVSLDIGAGEFVAIVGANGAGKTSLIQAMSGVVTPPRGTVHLTGAARPLDVARTDSRTLSRHIGFVFQNPEHQFIAHTVFDEVAHGLRRQRLAEDDIYTRTTELLERFGLADKAQQHPFLLSGGQKRRLSVGTALVAGAPLLVLDEPTFGQDHARADELLALLDELRAGGTTIVVVTHDMQLVTDHAQRTVVLSHGRVVTAAATADVFADTALIEGADLRLPPLRQALHDLPSHPELTGIARVADLPRRTS
ncbi:ABC transporter ATP-binding protein [Microbacterium sp. C7(2022)]|uniref:ABC transporter ATP-binding protein n=1 Tax=Microbacterium sp. C7(2022) TaxID=2992759 RepID=UPI00237A1E94|nr:ABC transporter ATP-binding protein [Microbacterium sp. C7(2022)]MDE0545123.1 energy-coupling factor ABC transporter ATP-binding protein [Microbacterium sp. C7(2022)]